MDNWIYNLNNLQKEYGFPLKKVTELNIKLPQMTILDKQTTHFFTGDILDHSIVIMTVTEINIKRIRNLITELMNNNNPKTNIILAVTKVNKSERMQLLNNLISFITLDGEFFLPQFNIKLYPVPNLMENSTLPLTTMGQKLFMLLVIDMMKYEQKNSVGYKTDYSFSHLENGFYQFKGGSEFIANVGQLIGINNRVSFNRAITDLIKHGLIKTVGETKDKQYYTILDSKQFFQTGESFLQSPLKNQETLFKCDDVAIKDIIDGALVGGNSALNKISMLAYEGPTTYVVDSHTFDLTKAKYQNQTFISNTNHETTDENTVVIQTANYNLKFFSIKFSQISDFSAEIVDPLHLYLMFRNSNDDRVLGEIEELLNNIWR